MLTTKYKNITASNNPKTKPGFLRGFYVNSTTGGTIKFYDGTTNAGTVMTGVITPAIGYHKMGDVAFNVALFAEIANTLDVTLFYE